MNILSSFDHPNILKPHEIFIDNCKVCCVLEFMDNDLRKYIQKRIINPIEIFLHIVNGIDFLHENNVIHGDLKLENILVKYKPKVLFKISDLNSIISPLNKTEKYYSMGTPRYIAPELHIREYTHYSNKVDIWSLGCIFYELFSKGLIFPTAKNMSDLIILKNKPINNIDIIPDQYKPLLFSMLNTDPELRPTTKQILEQFNYTPSSGLCKFNSVFNVNNSIEYKEIKLKILPLVLTTGFSEEKNYYPYVIDTVINILDRYFYDIENIVSENVYNVCVVSLILSYKLFKIKRNGHIDSLINTVNNSTIECSILKKLNFELYIRT